MLSLPVVERLDVVEQIRLRLGPRTVVGAMHPLILQAVEEALARRVVTAVPLAAHRADHFVLGKQRLKGVARILASPVAQLAHHTRRAVSALVFRVLSSTWMA